MAGTLLRTVVRGPSLLRPRRLHDDRTRPDARTGDGCVPGASTRIPPSPGGRVAGESRHIDLPASSHGRYGATHAALPGGWVAQIPADAPLQLSGERQQCAFATRPADQ